MCTEHRLETDAESPNVVDYTGIMAIPVTPEYGNIFYTTSGQPRRTDTIVTRHGGDEQCRGRAKYPGGFC